jgi:hypothetical protein
MDSAEFAWEGIGKLLGRQNDMKVKLKNICGKFYRALPIVRELHFIEGQIAPVSPQMNLLRACSIIQALDTIKSSDLRYRDPQRLLVYGAQYWSQNYEDGMIAEIFRRIGTVSKTFLEIGVGDGSENNTTALLVAGWKGWWIEGDETSCGSISAQLKKMPTIASRLKVRQAFVNPDDIESLLSHLEVPPEVDLFALDIDLNTYHIWAALSTFKPRVIVVEYNAGIPPSQVWIHPFEPNRVWDGTQAFGASLKAYELLGQKFGYSLVGCDLIGINAFFIRDDLLKEHFVAPFTSENHYESPRYQLVHRFGHPSKFYGETHSE